MRQYRRRQGVYVSYTTFWARVHQEVHTATLHHRSSFGFDNAETCTVRWAMWYVENVVNQPFLKTLF